MGQVRTTFILILFFSASFSGCLSNEPTGEKIDLLVNYELNNGTVVESYSNGELISTSKVTLDFDFSQTTADNKLLRIESRLKKKIGLAYYQSVVINGEVYRVRHFPHFSSHFTSPIGQFEW